MEFVVDTVKDNPIAQLYRDDLAGQAIAMKNVGNSVSVLHGDFTRALSANIRGNLMAEESTKFRTLVDNLQNFDFGTNAPVDEDIVLLNTIALKNANRFKRTSEHRQTGSDPGTRRRYHESIASWVIASRYA